MRRRVVALAVAVLALAPASDALALTPSSWPEGVALGSAANAIRFGGIDRYHTSLAISLALQGTGDQPFASPDRAAAWWGTGTCPRSVIVVAGDTPADALAAASLSDPTNRSDEPRLERVAAADPLFDPVGGFDRVDTAYAPIIVTTPGRAGARALAPAARVAVADVRAGRCTTAREAIIVGGSTAVPREVEIELVSLGYEEVFRVAGLDRFDTAARIATALGTEAAPAGADCDDEAVDDGDARMAFYGNAVFEYRADAKTCQVLGRAVVLAEGEIGADALAAGWWTSYWQIPLLLVRADGTLPEPTRTTLQTVAIDTIIVLGGTGRIPEQTVQEAARLAGATVGRFAGRDRYETSARTASAFGGWYPTNDADDFTADRLCLAASTGADVGWPDALAAGPLCGRLSARPDRSAPTRVLEPVERAAGTVGPVQPAHDATPVLLVPAGAVPTAEVSALLGSAFRADGQWCRAGGTAACRAPGFAAAFGGSAVVSDGALGVVSALLAGGDVAQSRGDPGIVAPFRTELDLAPVYAGDVGGPVACIAPDAVQGARWLAIYADPSLSTFDRAADLVLTGAYERDGGSAPRCLAVDAGAPTPTVVALSAAGRPSLRHVLQESGGAIRMTEAMRHDGPLSTTGAPGASTASGDSTEWRFRDAPASPLDVVEGDARERVAQASATVRLVRGAAGEWPRVDGIVVLDTAGDQYEVVVNGTATRVGTRWELAGTAEVAGRRGGFRATIETANSDTDGDDVLTWRIDALV